jgi:GNAT superfamily N-acetyltransferase
MSDSSKVLEELEDIHKYQCEMYGDDNHETFAGRAIAEIKRLRLLAFSRAIGQAALLAAGQGPTVLMSETTFDIRRSAYKQFCVEQDLRGELVEARALLDECVPYVREVGSQSKPDERRTKEVERHAKAWNLLKRMGWACCARGTGRAEGRLK